MDLKKEYCQLNGYSKFNKYNENNYTKFLEKKITELNQALQLIQTGVMRRYFHPFVGAGSLVKETEKSLVIKLDFNGKEYFAPKHEFTELL